MPEGFMATFTLVAEKPGGEPAEQPGRQLASQKARLLAECAVVHHSRPVLTFARPLDPAVARELVQERRRMYQPPYVSIVLYDCSYLPLRTTTRLFLSAHSYL